MDLAIYEPLLTVMGPQLIEFDQLGLVQGRTGSRTPLIAPRNTYRTRDGRWIALSGASPSVFERLCRSLGVPELPADARFRDNQARLANVEALDDALQAAVARFDQADLLARLDAAEAVAAPVRGADEVLADPHYRARGSIATVDDAELGPLRMQNAIGRLSATPGGIRHAGPRLGEHNRAVLVDESRGGRPLAYTPATTEPRMMSARCSGVMGPIWLCGERSSPAPQSRDSFLIQERNQRFADAELRDHLFDVELGIRAERLRGRFDRLLIAWRKRPQRMLYPIPKLAQHGFRHVDRILRHKKLPRPSTGSAAPPARSAICKNGGQIVEQQMRLIEEEDQLRLLRIADFGQLLEQLTHQPEQKRRIKLRRLQQLVRGENIHDAAAPGCRPAAGLQY